MGRDAGEDRRGRPARAHVFTPHPYTLTTADHGVDDPLEDDPAKLRDQYKDAASQKRYAARQQTEDGRAVFREDGRHAVVLWTQRLVDIEAHALERGIELNPPRRRPAAERGRGGGAAAGRQEGRAFALRIEESVERPSPFLHFLCRQAESTTGGREGAQAQLRKSGDPRSGGWWPPGGKNGHWRFPRPAARRR